jgi:hypothetical protein
MNSREARYAWLLKVYPRHYRNERGKEILGTLLDATSDHGGAGPAVLEVVDVLSHGIQKRLGLTSERFGGRILEMAAAPGMTMGAALAVFLFIWGEWLPLMGHSQMATRFGPFLTIGPVVYLAWVLGAVGSLLWPRRRRSLATICVIGTLVAVPIGKIFFASPNFWQLVLLASFGVPGILASTTASYRRRVASSLLAGATTFAVFWLFGGIHPVGAPFVESFYWYGNTSMAHGLPLMAGAAFLATIALFGLRTTERAGAVVVLTSPMLIIAAASVREADGFIGGNSGEIELAIMGAAALMIPIAWLAVAWSLDLRRTAAGAVDSSR